MIELEAAPFAYDENVTPRIDEVTTRVADLRQVGKLSPDSLRHLSKFFRIKNIYHSNAIEGNQLAQGETELVVEQGLTIAGKPLKDQVEARSLANALDYFEDLVSVDTPIAQNDIHQIHQLILTGINDDEAGQYRNVEVRISGSHYDPITPDRVPYEMTQFSDWLRASTDAPQPAHAIVTACAAHAWFAQVHPFVDGNGRTARILMNLLLMRNGYPIAIITKEERSRYYDALEESQSGNLSPFIQLVCESVLESLEAYESAAEDQLRRQQWILQVADRLQAPERIRRENEYEVWSRAMELFRAHFRLVSELLDDAAQGLYRVYFKKFGTLELDKYLALSSQQSAKRTWFFRIDIVRQEESSRHLFYFNIASPPMRDRSSVTIHVSREEPPGSFWYERLRDILGPHSPPFTEIGYDMQEEHFVCARLDWSTYAASIEAIANKFISSIVDQF